MSVATVPSTAGDRPGDRPGGRSADEQRALLRTARDVADDLAADALVREQAGRPPTDERTRLREAGLLAALTPPSPGRGTDWRTGCAVIREVAAADSSVGDVLARHYVHTWSGRFYASPHQAATLEEASVREQWLWTGAVRAPAPAENGDEGADLTLRHRNTGYILDGHRAVDTAVAVADQIVLDAVCAVTGDVLVVRISPRARGVSVEAAHERLGQRVAGAGEVVLDRVTVSPGQVLGRRPHDEESTAPFTALAEPALRLALCHVVLGIVEGALTEARDLSRGGRAHRLPGEDPDLLLTYGELASAAHTAIAVVDRATEAMAQALDAGTHLDAEEPAGVAALVATAETVVSRAALHITTRVLELADAPGLDRFWRNARVLTAHRPVAHRLRSIGEHYLNGSHRAVAAAFH
ncbi:acyl-CoA dehydrogenase family protein [Streptomyces yangpuensis]|uniref:Acyl-CoA dehydrogenase family protein n=1 Tax=Streptomyces yangpuensis TaxID=1648182 RepID=A0ABY5PP24_9ACTN|nr:MULTISPECIES: acyl-CoA dehydrogenase family protein [Streptomyces]MBZ9593758.1 acyl-CoA dehydrogenase family protein [Streptomyces erythrochromogenes]UUY45824.1 acyl-CoA dehydrogenase family protein [Streptomyces yangpuensis]